MKKIFRKAITVLGSAALIGMTVGSAMAASYPAPFTSNTAIVVGANAAPSDNIAASSIASNLDAASAGDSATTLTGGESITEDKITLGGLITAGAEIDAVVGNSDIESLIEDTLSWDDGSGSENYDISEEIRIGDVKVLTTTDDEDYTDNVALTNDEGLSYAYILEDGINASAIGTDDADDLYLTILGKSYEINALSTTSITVVTSEEVSVGIGESVTVQGETFTVDDLSSESARINGVTIGEGNSKKINGLQVKVDADSIFYNDNFPEQASLTLKIGEDIAKEYQNNDEYIGEDDDDPLWRWNISLTTTEGLTSGTIGVYYDATNVNADDDDSDDSVKYIGDSYMFPNNFAEVSLDELTDVEYSEVTVEFDEIDLYNNTEEGDSTETDPTLDEKEVIVISVDDGDSDDSFTIDSEDTDTIYLYYAETGNAFNATTNGSVELYYKDIDGEYSPSNEARFSQSWELDALTAGDLSVEVATLTVGDTELSVNVTIVDAIATLSFIDDEGSIAFTIGGDTLASDGGSFEQFGAYPEDSDANDVIVDGVNVSTYDTGSVMSKYGIVVAEGSDVDSQAEDDSVSFDVPDEQVYATVSVTAGGDASTTSEAGVMTVMDSAASTVSGKNLVVVGGSAINSVAAELLGGAYSEAAFTSNTDVAAGEFLIQSFDRSGKTALLVAGYNAADTEKAVTYLLNNDVDTTVGMKMTGTSATEATVVTA